MHEETGRLHIELFADVLADLDQILAARSDILISAFRRST
jgi:hypothetical protein